MADKLNPSRQPDISVTFRMSEPMYKEMMKECGRCSCNVSAFVRHAVVKEIRDREQARRNARVMKQLDGQTSILDVNNA